MISFLVDESISRSTAQFLRDRGHDVQTLPEAGLEGAEDAAIFEHARTSGRVVLTLDKDFGTLYYFSTEHPPGVVVVRVPRATPDRVNASIEGYLDAAARGDFDPANVLVILTSSRRRVIGRQE